MSGKLDQSLDEILSTQRRGKSNARGRGGRRSAGGKPANVAPAGGIQKNTKPARNAGKQAPAKNAGLTGESKIVVSNLVSRVFPPCPCVASLTANSRCSPRTFPKARSRYVITDEAI